MNKFLLALPILVFPLIAQAANKPTHASNSMIQATERKFLPNYCAKGIEGLAVDVYDCFQQIKSSDPKQEECLIADMMVTSTVILSNKKATALGKAPEYNMPFFTPMEAGKRSSNFMKENTKFKDYTMLEFATYLANSYKNMMVDNEKLYKEANGNCSAYFKP